MFIDMKRYLENIVKGKVNYGTLFNIIVLGWIYLYL